MRTPHSSTNKGKRVKITMRNGSVIVGKFYDKKIGVVLLEGVHDYVRVPPGKSLEYNVVQGKIRLPMKDVRAFSIYKPTSK